MSEMSRAEDLARKLFKLYKFTVRSQPGAFSNPTCEHVHAKPAGPGIYWSDGCVYTFRSWNEVLFGDHSLNSHIRAMANDWKTFKRKVPLLLEYTSLDELDIQLTLAGANHA